MISENKEIDFKIIDEFEKIKHIFGSFKKMNYTLEIPFLSNENNRNPSIIPFFKKGDSIENKEIQKNASLSSRNF